MFKIIEMIVKQLRRQKEGGSSLRVVEDNQVESVKKVEMVVHRSQSRVGAKIHNLRTLASYLGIIALTLWAILSIQSFPSIKWHILPAYVMVMSLFFIGINQDQEINNYKN